MNQAATSLSGRHALVTGGGRGIGRAVAAALTRAGAVVTVAGRDAAHVTDAVACGDAEAYAVCDVTDAAALTSCIRAAADARGAVDVLVASAGGAETARFRRAEADQFRRMFELNVMGVVHAVKAVLDGMIERGFGRIVVIASTAGLKGYPYVSAYCAAKHAVIGLVRSVAIETARSGVTINAVCPTYTDTEMLQHGIDEIVEKTGQSRAHVLAMFEKTAPIGRLVKPDEVAAAVLFLCSPEASAITGATLTVAGGEI
jgi:NAD(P)-dependent dehydrogenase (short-subunit alcohol dehydrogenase family)